MSLPAPGLVPGSDLRTLQQYVLGRIAEGLERDGFDDVRPAHFAVFQVLPAEGLRSTELAALANITKQSMGALLDHLVDRGYLERAPDPDDGRARIVRLTARGWELVTSARKCVEEVEAEWERHLGTRRYRQFREALDRLNALASGG